jgi:hypothetical protein
MLHANPKTRRQNQTAGESVDVEGYLRKMAENATDGDHLTLQVSEGRGEEEDGSVAWRGVVFFRMW